jgi:hypothetical protein
MTTHQNTSEMHTRLANIIQKDIKNLIQQEGKVTEGDIEIILKDPATTDPSLQILANDPNLDIRPIGDQNKSGEMYFDLSSNGKQVRIKIISRTIKPETK